MANKNQSWKNIRLRLTADFISLLTEVFANSLRSFLRIKAGRFGHGWLLFFLTLFLMLLWNQEKRLSAYYDLFRDVAYLFWGLISGNGADWKELTTDLIRPSSLMMHYFIMAYAVIGFIKLIGSYFGLKDEEDQFSKGTSISYLLWGRYTKRLSHTFYKAIWEPIGIILLAVCLFPISKTFSIWLIVSSVFLAIQENMDGAVRIIDKDETKS